MAFKVRIWNFLIFSIYFHNFQIYLKKKTIKLFA